MTVPFATHQEFWTAQASSQTLTWESHSPGVPFDPGKALSMKLMFRLVGFSGTLDFQSSPDGVNFHNIPYQRVDTAPLGDPSVAQLSFTTVTGDRDYVLTVGPWRYVRIVMTRTAGSITGWGEAYEHAILTSNPAAPTVDTELPAAVAHDAVDAGEPLKIGGKADTDNPPAVADADRTDAWFDRHGRLHTRSGHQGAAANVWTAISLPAANTQATASKAAAGVGIRNVCVALTVVLAATGTAPTALNLQVNLIDGVSGGVVYLWRATISIPATAGAVNGITISGLWLPGTANTAMTLEFSAAGGLNTVESVSMSGVTITE